MTQMPFSNKPHTSCADHHSAKLGLVVALGRGLPVGCLILAISTAMAVNASDSPVLVDRTDLSAEDKARVAAITAPTQSFDAAEAYEAMQGGAGTAKNQLTQHAFSQPQPNLSFADREQFSLGNALFRKVWVSSPASTLASDGLGPLFNARACQACHIQDGRGHLPGINERASSLVVTLTGHGEDDASSIEAYGHQLQTFAVPGLLAEATIDISYEKKQVNFADDSQLSLRQPTLSVSAGQYGDLAPSTILSARVAPPMIGLGLLESIAEADILALADPDDLNDDGISGRVNLINQHDETTLGRFGFRATKATVKDQVAAAFSADMGLSTLLHPANTGDCTATQIDCFKFPDGEQAHLGAHEVPDELLQLVSFYSANLAPPERRGVADEQVLAGKEQFYNAGCTACHQAKYVTSRDALMPQHQFQLIWPYTDLLLHDMGDALADKSVDGSASANTEWRTPPLWGIGLTKTINARASYLHDGRARTLLEAIVWHGGEAEQAKNNVLKLSQENRTALIKFLESL